MNPFVVPQSCRPEVPVASWGLSAGLLWGGGNPHGGMQASAGFWSLWLWAGVPFPGCWLRVACSGGFCRVPAGACLRALTSPRPQESPHTHGPQLPLCPSLQGLWDSLGPPENLPFD